ncbi:MAG: cation:proton antiporter [Myxococcales bacterium]|nr:cation:proton antiporter [Myxococcales bacterium]
MSAAAPAKSWGARGVQAAVLLATVSLVLGSKQSIPVAPGVLAAISALGLLLLAGTLASELVEVVGLPHLSGYLLAGILVGPHVLNLVEHQTVEELGALNALALALIALAGGAELRLDALRKAARSLVWAHLLQTFLVLLAVAGAFLALARFIPFLDGMAPVAAVMVALLWGVLATSRSPAAVLGLLAQIRPKGPLTNMTVAFVMSSDVVVILLLAVTLAVARLGFDPSATLDLSAFSAVGHELLGSAALGTTLGLVLAVYLRLSGRGLMLVLLALGLPMSALLKYIHLDPLLSFMVAGFVVQNFSSGGERLLHSIEKTGAIVFVVFFATAGAHLDLPLLGRIWPIALGLAGVRMVATMVAARAASRLAGDEPVLKRWGWSGLVSQAGLALGLATVIVRAFPEFGDGFRTLSIAVIGVNEMIGPVLFKLGLDRAGESKRAIDESGAG